MMVMRAAWPSQSDYIMALQDPESAFIDPVLQAATVEPDDVFHLPRPRSGQMASVYKVFDRRGTWALRCFNFDSPNRAARYSAISAFLARATNRYTVDFEYAQDGIAVDGRLYPTVKMEWVEGELLHTYIANNLGNSAVLERLAQTWIEMSGDLHGLQFAHGDLQHGNVLVTASGHLKLIDYDGMFVPEFDGHPSTEDGHPNYQHPCRQAGDFGPQLDNFSVWTVFLSIVALARDPRTWETLRCGDDCLAFRRPDYVRPSTSAAFTALKSAADRDVRNIAGLLESMLSHEPLRLPALETCAQIVSPLHPRRQPDAREYRLSLVRADPLRAGIFAEPYERPAPAPNTDAEEPPSPRTISPALIRTGGGIAVSLGAAIAGYWVFHQLGFATNEYVAIVLLGCALAAVLAVASRSAKPPGGSQP